MALNFDTTTDTVNHGSGTSLDDLTTFTWLLWFYPKTGIANNDSIMMKGGAFPTSKGVIMPNSTNLQLWIGRSVETANRYTDNNPITLDVWNYAVFTYSEANGVKMYVGSLTAEATELTFAAGTTDGSGTTNTDATLDFIIGRNVALGLNAALMDVSFIGVWNKAMTLAQIQEQQFFLHPTDGCVLFSVYGNDLGSQKDQSGNQNHGTVTGATTTTGPAGVVFDYSGAGQFTNIKVGNGMSRNESAT